MALLRNSAGAATLWKRKIGKSVSEAVDQVASYSTVLFIKPVFWRGLNLHTVHPPQDAISQAYTSLPAANPLGKTPVPLQPASHGAHFKGQQTALRQYSIVSNCKARPYMRPPARRLQTVQMQLTSIKLKSILTSANARIHY